ncbi:MAG: sensor histidine kinase [Terriglobales bacterium]
MNVAFHRLPTILLLGALVPVFWFLYRSNRTPRVRMWVIAWILVLGRVLAQVFGAKLGASSTLINALDLGGLQLSGVVLLVSMTRIFEDPRHRWPFFFVVAVPSVAYAELYALNAPHLWLFVLAGVLFGTGSVAWVLAYHRRNLQKYIVVVCGLALLVVLWGAVRASHGRPDIGFYSIETLTYGVTAFLYWYSYNRLSPGVLLTSAGLLAWAAVFPAFYLLQPLSPQALEDLIGVGNVPKFWVAIGMIVTLLEDKTRTALLAESQERATREQIQRFSHLRSRLLSGADVASFCDEIAQAVAQNSTFSRINVLITDDQSTLYVAGTAGIDDETGGNVDEEVQQLTVAKVDQLCKSGLEVGPRSFRVSQEQLRDVGSLPSMNDPDTRFWQKGDKLLVPLRSPRGTLVGCIAMDEPRNVSRIAAEDMAAVEMLGADLAISIENSHLQRQLVLSEKLAGLGKLISGTGHELNNPLTAVLGYAEMLSGATHDEGTRRGAEVIRREALRMKQIIENLLRFARQTKFERRAVSLRAILEDVCRLRAYEIKRTGVQVSMEIAQNLPGVMVDEGLLKQVFLNILNNSLDALQGVSGRRVTVEALQVDDRIQLRFSDNGPGFTNLDRVFDPFFTTKSPGKGPGLGLSVSYGIIKQHGGEISARNLHPSGACIMIELPVAGAANVLFEATGVAEA